MARRVTVVLLVWVFLFASSASATPVFDCTSPQVRRDYPAQCPELGVPFLLGGGNPPGKPPAGCGGLCGIVRGVLDSLNPF